MNQSLQPQLLKFEEVMEEARHAGTTVQDELKQAVLMKAVSGQFKTRLNLQMTSSTTYNELRESVLKWDGGQQRWSGLVLPDDGDAMEVARMKGKKSQKGKGKYDDQKGKNKGKGKSKSKDSQKGYSKGKSKGKEKSGGKFNEGSKGKGGKSDTRTCRK